MTRWDGGPEARCVWRDALPVGRSADGTGTVRGGSVATYVYESGTYVPLARLDGPALGGGSTLYFQTDASGKPDELCAASGDSVWKAELRTWGATASETWVAKESAAEQQGHAVLQNVRFQGQYLDRETGLHYNNFRFYDPDIGRFISSDPIGLFGGENLHRYAPNSLRWTDPLGWYNGEGQRPLGVYHYFDEHFLSPSEYQLPDAEHFRRANQSVYERLEVDAEFRRTLQLKYPGVIEHVRPTRMGFRGTSPTGMTWHHGDADGSLRLVDRNDHRNFHKIYHPDGKGGRNLWGGGTTCRK